MLILVLGSVLPASGQITIPGAGEDKFGLLDGGKAITVTTGESKVAFNWSNDPKLSADDDCRQFVRGTQPYRDCLLRAVDKPQTFAKFNIAISGEEGKRSLFSDGGFIPGYEFTGSLTRRVERRGPTGKGGYTDLYGGLVVSTKPLRVGTFPDSGASSLDDASEKRFGATGGVNVFLRENLGIGFGATAARALSTAGLQKPVALCTTKKSGSDDEGSSVSASSCDDGFLGPLQDQTIGTIRVDVLRNFTRVKKDSAGNAAALATLGLIGSANVSLRTGAATAYNLAFGPTLHPKGVPHKVLLALVFKVSDITDAAAQDKTFKDKFAVTLYFGIPLTAF